MSATYLPVYQLSETSAPTASDYLVMQSSATGGDVELLSVTNFLNAFLKTYIDQIPLDQTTIDIYTSMGWTDPT